MPQALDEHPPVNVLACLLGAVPFKIPLDVRWLRVPLPAELPPDTGELLIDCMTCSLAEGPEKPPDSSATVDVPPAFWGTKRVRLGRYEASQGARMAIYWAGQCPG